MQSLFYGYFVYLVLLEIPFYLDAKTIVRRQYNGGYNNGNFGGFGYGNNGNQEEEDRTKGSVGNSNQTEKPKPGYGNWNGNYGGMGGYNNNGENGGGPMGGMNGYGFGNQKKVETEKGSIGATEEPKKNNTWGNGYGNWNNWNGENGGMNGPYGMGNGDQNGNGWIIQGQNGYGR